MMSVKDEGTRIPHSRDALMSVPGATSTRLTRPSPPPKPKQTISKFEPALPTDNISFPLSSLPYPPQVNNSTFNTKLSITPLLLR